MPTSTAAERIIGQLSTARELIGDYGDVRFLDELQNPDEETRRFAEEGPRGVIAAIMFNFGIGQREVQMVAMILGIPAPTTRTTFREFLEPVMAAA